MRPANKDPKSSRQRTLKSKAGRNKRPTVGQRIIEGLEEAVAWSHEENVPAREFGSCGWLRAA